jgi:hypothetical protein
VLGASAAVVLGAVALGLGARRFDRAPRTRARVRRRLAPA